MNCEILGISFDAPEANKAFREKHDFPFQLLSDYDEQVGVLYQTRDPGTEKVSFSKRYSYLIDPDGMIRKSYEVSDIPAHPAEVLADLHGLQDAA
jgi:thioredoxin-dependent peroxiredoxin